MPKPEIFLLTNNEKEVVHSKALIILEDLGMEIKDKEIVNFLIKNGCKLKNGERVIFPEDVVNNALKTVPKEFKIYDRDGEFIATLGEGAELFAPGSAAIKILDFESKEPRLPQLNDLKNLVIIVDYLKNIQVQSTALVPDDVSNLIKDAVRLYVILKYSNKPIVTGAFTIENLPLMIEMLKAIREDYSERPWTIFDVTISSPLTWSEITIRNLYDLSKEKIPAEIISMPQMSATSPATVAGSLVLHHAEVLSGITISQLVNPGTPVIYGGSTAILEPNFALPLITAPESILLSLSYNEMAKYIKLPTHTYLSLSDNKILDYQAGAQTMYSALAAVLRKFDVISGPGMLENELVQSLEKIVLDNEIAGIVKRVSLGYDIEEDQLALDVIRNVVNTKKHEFLSQIHTKRYLRKEFYFPTYNIWDVSSRDKWDGKDSLHHAHLIVEKILKEYTPHKLIPEKLENLNLVYENLWKKTHQSPVYI